MEKAVEHQPLRIAVALAVALLAAGGATRLWAAPPAEAAGRGWRGEALPEGLERGKKEGEYVWKKDGAIMVYVPPGPFLMGSDQGAENERPAHTVELDGYYIDKYEVSWRKWKSSGLPYLEGVNDRLSIVQAPDWHIHDAQPVVNVSWNDAKSYAAWAGKRLPTEAEWEKAARGTDGRRYPWGNDPPTFERAMWTDHPMSQTSTAPVNCCQAGASPYGAVNMAGNVMEWCEDNFSNDYYARSPRKNPVNLGRGEGKVLRGGAFQLEPKFLETTNRYRLLDVDRISDIGFRTVVSSPAPTGR